MEERDFTTALEMGIDLFNRQAFAEAYEVLQTRWEVEEGDGADLLQGLLQVAAGLAKLQGGNPRGTIKLLDLGLEKLALYEPEAYDVDVSMLMETVRRWKSRAEALVSEGRVGGNTVSRIVSDVDAVEQASVEKKPWWRRLF